MKLKYVFVMLLGIALIACNKETDDRSDEEKILDFLAENNLTADRHESGLYYQIKTPGSSERPEVTDSVTVRYKGTLLSGHVFDQTPGSSTITFPLRNLIPAWQIGIPLVGKGGEVILYCPSNLGYGNRAFRTIPAGSVLIFEIDLVDFK
ncbi:FKBP-type peptidyl-prolyl cis-trans isomerase [Phaeodactylibacter sp.]|uniref:FKBP-type peptidyl-prolyl cis-trans isomerase n=1 Tax=Phaeodactylibacter sp. TaxID=1940289 RepID=UPI0025ECBD83|nr:FKBP-type peptidyl-prolyl cis-trans isomerase [Phaeodactylibacter sp.]MCI5091692.1 FKBP-type peptidyl-prolyl cis-trans isomerase [Phaeodactylibacter sp.]